MKLSASQETVGMRGYWKLNNSLLSDDQFNDTIKNLINEILNNGEDVNYCKKWEFFKYKVRCSAIKRSKILKQEKLKQEKDLTEKLSLLYSKDNITQEEEIELKNIQMQLDHFYLNLAKGAFIRSRAKWLEEGEKNTSYFFALEKRNIKRKSLTALNINGTLSKDPKSISKFVSDFYENLYKSNFNANDCATFLDNIQTNIPSITQDFKSTCESDLSAMELKKALFSMKRGKSPGVDGLSVEFYTHFWDLIHVPLLCMYKECITQGEMTPSMKQGIISLIPKPEKDSAIIENWRPITLLTIDYKILALSYANRLKTGLDTIISETQTGFMKNRHISCNIRLILDLLDYPDAIDSDALILFLDFYKAFDTIEHSFLLQSLKSFGFGNSFIDIVSMFYNDINSSVIINLSTSKRFQINRGVRQGCPISPFLFILVTELLSIHIKNDINCKGISIFDKELKLSQLADDTTIFLKDKHQISIAIDLINKFSNASGLRLNMSKCEILPIHECEHSSFENIPVKNSIKYLGIYITKNHITRQHLNFSNRIKKTTSIFNLWLQRDLSIHGRVLLSKAEGLSRFIYPSQSLFVNNLTATQINKMFSNFIWKNRSHKVKKAVLSKDRDEGGLEVLNFTDVVNAFKINWLRRCLLNRDSIWYPEPYFQPNWWPILSFKVQLFTQQITNSSI